VIEFNTALRRRGRQIEAVLTATLLSALVGCARSNEPAANQQDTTLSIGYGENAEVGIQQAVRNIATEGLVRIDRDGRPKSWLAERWTVSPDGLTWQLALRPGASFHDGQAATAPVVRDIVARDLPGYLGPAFEDVREIRAVAPYSLEVALKRRSTLLLEGLDMPIQVRPEAPIGTGPFSVSKHGGQEVEMQANRSYYGGIPGIDRIVFRSYDSVRSAWADMLRGRVDMLYEVGANAIDFLKPSTHTQVFTFERAYAFLVFLNIRNPKLRDRELRRSLNAAIDRNALIADALNGHGTPADGPVWPYHWAYSQESPRFRFDPGGHPLTNVGRLRCLITTDQSHERMALALQRQLRAIGIELMFEQVSPEQFVARFQAGDFETGLIDTRMGPSLLRQHQVWYSNAPFNWGQFSSTRVDGALDHIRSAADDTAYKAGVAEFQSAIVEDPPAIFLAWGERLRAVSTRFEVRAEPGRDITSTLRLWRPVADGPMIDPN
jgi:peptide/nickel transport system substrate-binding protein